MEWPNCLNCILIFTATVVFYCEFLMYYVTLVQCQWPKLSSTQESSFVPVKSVIIADTHLLGPINGHWFDKLIREWHMHRAFQTTMTIFHPDVVFILGDVFDEGQAVNDEQFNKYVQRFRRLFYAPKNTQVISVVGNHDVGFHYRMDPYFLNRFEKEFNYTGVHLHTIKNVHFVFVNSMAMENDRCAICTRAQKDLNGLGKKLMCMKDPDFHKCPRPQSLYSRPILMQHFPTYRRSDEICSKGDAPEIERYKEKWDVLSKESTITLGNTINPRLAFSGHSHHYCKLKNLLGIDEYTVASYSWRNKLNPSFLLAKFTPQSHSVMKCDMPTQTTYVSIYIYASSICLVYIVLNLLRNGIKKYSEKKVD
ncbi:metallophosphoesterase 1 homolog [Eupeodes corollae]|uniref:metallophosphoesterase 1 homolog n=1 Tax=Eupeodes corollae TaxID=290404 RepID=UPI00249140BF|nr:metallophosphoesterase 1 homolog [Eupeodes corollae]